MRLEFQEKPWDLYISFGYTAVVTAFLLVINAGTPFALLLVLFAPGYAFVAALFPSSHGVDKPGINWVERIALSFALSIAVVPLLGLLLGVAPWGIRFAPLVAALTIFTIAVGLIALWRRMRLPPEQRLSLFLDLGVPQWREYPIIDKGLTVALGVSIVVAGGILAYVLTTPPPMERFTEFYILGPGGNASGYPTRLNMSESGTVLIGVANHETSRVNYTIRVDLVGVRLNYNATEGVNETVEVNRTTLSMMDVTLADSQNWTQSYTFRISGIGLWKVQYLLFKERDFSRAYRETHLYVQVS